MGSTCSNGVLGYDIEYVTSDIEEFDVIVCIGENLTSSCFPTFVKPFLDELNEQAEFDRNVLQNVQTRFIKDKSPNLMVWSPTGPINRDYDDVRRYEEAAIAGMKRALKSGKQAPLVVVYSSEDQRTSPKYQDALLISVLGACEAAYVPLEIRVALPEKSYKITKMGVSSIELKTVDEGTSFVNNVIGIEWGRLIARDIGGSDPENMTAEQTEIYLSKIFEDTNIKMSVVKGQENFVRDYPLFAAVNRCADQIERHRGRIIYLEYCSEEDVKNTYLFVGKGVTYDTGGADLKVGGSMPGMHRDKCGAAVIAGIFGMIEKLKPKGVKVVGRLAMVRNSIGADCYVSDEIITSAAGVRVRVGNTDAEGRMAMADNLYHSKEQALSEVNPHLFTVATLTGHAIVAVGNGYTIVIDNGPAKEVDFAGRIQQIGDGLSNPFEISTLRREDYDFVTGKSEYEDALQANNKPSSATPRGHQFPAAFLIKSAGLENHGTDSSLPLKYSHLEIAASMGPFPGIPAAAPVAAIGKLLNAF